MSLATELLKKVQEAKQAAADEMSVPSYDNLHTPNNHVSNTSNATKEAPVSGLGDRKVEHPTAEVGTPGKEKRDMEGPKQKPKKKVSEQGPMQGAPGSGNRVLQALGIGVSNGMLHWHHPANPDMTYQVEYTPEVKNAFRGAVAQLAGSGEDPVQGMWEFLTDLSEHGTGYDPRMTAVGESKKTAHGELAKPSVKTDGPAHSARVRGKQDDEPTNKGNPGTGREEKGQPKQQFSMNPKDFKGGENEHKSMKKMHETVNDLEELLGKKLDFIRVGFQTPKGGKLVENEEIPKGQIEWLMGRVHVGTPDEEVVADFEKRMQPDWPDEVKRAIIDYALEVHRRNQNEYTSVMRGRF